MQLLLIAGALIAELGWAIVNRAIQFLFDVRT